MSALISLQVENRIVTKIEIPANDPTDQLTAVDLLRDGLIETILNFNESQIDEKIRQALKGGDIDE